MQGLCHCGSSGRTSHTVVRLLHMPHRSIWLVHRIIHTEACNHPPAHGFAGLYTGDTIPLETFVVRHRPACPFVLGVRHLQNSRSLAMLSWLFVVQRHAHPCRSCIRTRSENSTLSVHPQDFAHGSDVVIHESVGPVYNFNHGLPPVSTNILTNHTSQQEVICHVRCSWTGYPADHQAASSS